MKKLIFIFLIIFSLSSKLSFSQQLLISPSPQDDFTLGYTKVIGQSEAGYFVLTSNLSFDAISDRAGFKTRKYKVGFYSTSLVRKWDRTLKPLRENANIDAVTFLNDQVFVVSSYNDKPQKQLQYYISLIDTAGKENKINAPVTTFKINNNDYEKCNIVISQSSEKFSIVTREYDGEKNQPLLAAVISSDLQSVVLKHGIIPFTEKTFDLTNFSLSNNGDLMVLGLNSEKIKAMSAKRKTDYFLFSSPDSSQEFRMFNAGGDRQITGIEMAFDNVNQQAVLAGFYNDKDSYLGAGIYYATLKTETNDSLEIQAHSIDSQQNIRLKGERNTGNGINLVSYPIGRIVLRNDGGAVIVAEAAYTTEYSYYDSFSQSFTRRLEYNFNNVIAISINKDGIADWSTIIEKQQVSMDDGGIFSSFCSLLNSEQLVIIYNDEISRRNKVIPVSINNLGASTRQKPFTQNEGMLLIPKCAKQVSENEIVVPALIKRKLHLTKFTF